MTMYDYERLCDMYGTEWVHKRFPRSCRHLLLQIQKGVGGAKGT